jgi:hypothetical protein
LFASAPVLCEPLMASAPLQSPPAVHAVESVEVHVKVEDAPAATEAGLALICTVGSGLTVTVTVAGALVPPAPLHVTVKLPVPDMAPVLWVPLVASVPLHAPDAAQEVALLEDQVSSLGAPGLTVVGEALMDAVGTGGGGLELPPPQEASRAAVLTSRILGINPRNPCSTFGVLRTVHARG